MTSTVVITGAAGRIGRELRTLLAAPDRVLRLLDIAPQDPLTDGEQAEIVTGSYTDAELMARVLDGADGIVHLGGVASERAWAEILATNIDRTQRLLESAHSAGFVALDDASSVPSAPLADEPARLGGTWTQLALGERP